MFNSFALNGLKKLGLSVVAAVAIAAPSAGSAAPHGGGGGYHGGSVSHAGYGYHGYYGPGFSRGYRGGYYGRSYYAGYRGYYGGYGYRGWGYGGWGWPTGLFLASLPLYYSTWWWNGVPYYYANDSYYIWDAPGARYAQITPPDGLLGNGAPASAGAAGSAVTDLFAYPKNGQSNGQQAQDRQECRDWAAAQTSGGATGAIAAATPQNADAGLRAQTACLEARGYSVR